MLATQYLIVFPGELHMWGGILATICCSVGAKLSDPSSAVCHW